MLVDLLLPEDKKKLVDLEKRFNELDVIIKQNKATENVITSLINDFQLYVNDMNIRIDELIKIANKECSGVSHKEEALHRVSHLKTKTKHIVHSFDILKKNYNQIVTFQKNKNELFHSSYSNSSLDLELAENASLVRSTQMVDEYINSGMWL